MIWLLALAVAFLGGMPGEATADQIITLTNANSAINPPFTGPYGTVDVHWVNSTKATIKLTANTVTIGGTNYIYMFGDGGTIGLNVNAASFTASNIVGSITQGGSGFQPWSLVGTGSGNEDGFGMFNFQVNSFDGFAHVIDTLTLTLTNNSGTWGSASSVLTRTRSSRVRSMSDLSGCHRSAHPNAMATTAAATIANRRSRRLARSHAVANAAGIHWRCTPTFMAREKAAFDSRRRSSPAAS